MVQVGQEIVNFTERDTLKEKAVRIEITDTESYVRATDTLTAIKDMRLKIAGLFDEIIASAHAAHKKTLWDKKEAEAPLVEAENSLKPKVAAYLQEQERIRKEEERRLDEIARKQEEDARLAEAIAAEAAGEKETANEIINEEIPAPVVYLPKSTPKTGVSVREIYSAEVTSLQELIKAVAAGRVPIQAIQANMTFLNNQARAMKQTLNYPGVAVRCEKSVSARSSAY